MVPCVFISTDDLATPIHALFGSVGSFHRIELFLMYC